MAYLTGITTWGNLLTDFRELMCGRKVDDYGNSVPNAQKWRDPFAGMGGTAAMILVPPENTCERESLQEHRQGYWARVDDCAIFFDRTGTHLQHIRQTGIWTGWHVNFAETLVVSIRTVTRNTVAGDYSNATIEWSAFSLSTTGGYNPVRSTQTVALNAAGEATLTYTSGTTVTCTIRVTNPETGFLETNTAFYRYFSSQFKGGIDAWRNYIKNIGAVTQIVPPSGVNDVDYSFTGNKTPGHTTNPSSTYYSQLTGGNFPSVPLGHGLGIKTNAGLTGERYEISFKYTNASFWFTTSGMEMQIRWAIPAILPNGNVYTGMESSTQNWPFVVPFATTPTAATEVQYFLTVRDDAFALTLYGDSSTQGRISTNMVARIKGYDEEDPNKTWGFGQNNAGSSASNDNYFRCGPLMTVEKVMVRGWMDSGRNWQTGDGRWDTCVLANGQGYGAQDQGYSTSGSLSSSKIMSLERGSIAPVPQTNNSPDVFKLLKEPGWRTGSWTLNDGQMITSITSYAPLGYWRERGYLEDPPIRLVPQGAYAAGDELLDLTTNNRYKLFGRSGWHGWMGAESPGYMQAMF